MQAALNSENPGAAAEIYTNQLPNLIGSDPWAVVEFARKNQTQSWYRDFTRALAEGWAKVNPEEAARWVAQMDDTNERNNLLGTVCFQVAQLDSAQAIRILEDQGVHDERRRTMLGNLAHDWAIRDLAQATDWAGSYPAGEIRDVLFKQIALAESKSSPLEAAQLIVQQIPPGPTQLSAGMAVLREWSRLDPAGATAWSEQFPDGETGDFVRDEVARIVAHQASQQANELPVRPD
jgi:hypothetical protein